MPWRVWHPADLDRPTSGPAVVKKEKDGGERQHGGVQRLSRAASQLQRCFALLPQLRSVSLYGVNDLRLTPEQWGCSHPKLVTLVLDQSRRTDLEWFRFVVIETLEFSTALVAQQMEGDPWADRAPPRTYKGFWTFEPALVQQIVGILRHAARILVEETE